MKSIDVQTNNVFIWSSCNTMWTIILPYKWINFLSFYLMSCSAWSKQLTCWGRRICIHFSLDWTWFLILLSWKHENHQSCTSTFSQHQTHHWCNGLWGDKNIHLHYKNNHHYVHNFIFTYLHVYVTWKSLVLALVPLGATRTR